MSFIINNEIKFSDSINLDGFGRLRISEPFNLFNSTNVLTSGDTYYETILSGGCSVNYNQDKSEVQFNITGNNQRALREQHGYNYYQPGKSQLIYLSGIFGTPTNNIFKRMGYYNDNDGLYFELSGLTFGITLRTSTNGSIINTFINQSSWNIDTLNTGSTLNPSSIHLDITKTNIFVVYFQWLGVGRVIFALDIDGILIPVHQILNANVKDIVYMKSGNLPVRYEVLSTTGSTDSTFKQICSSVISEGGQTDIGYIYTISNGLTTRTFSSKQAVISIRLANTFFGQPNRTIVKILNAEVLTTTNTGVNAYWELVYQRGYLGENNLGGSPTWSSLANSPLEFSVNGTTVLSGTTIDSGYIRTTLQSGESVGSITIDSKILMALNYSAGTSDWLHLVITPDGNSSWSGKVNLRVNY